MRPMTLLHRRLYFLALVEKGMLRVRRLAGTTGPALQAERIARVSRQCRMLQSRLPGGALFQRPRRQM